ncbi:kanadaptin [Wyeomyia smithii]|uniref:kanadaptin n=1 Tax=Wyeomyia smithii TaxID=174621 RepID=UPI002467C9A6|nr:kanadaptin [Wyeomyia smithii]XP_055534946.1 kanadaptin [Wyeomyia smithii]
MADDETTFKKPSFDPKVLGKIKKPDLPASTADTSVASSSDERSSKDKEQHLTSDASEIPPIPYKEPSWSRKCDFSLNYGLEVLKNGVIIEEVKHLQNKAYWLFGRLPNCDINMAHPTISRYHAILQYKSPPEATSDDSDEEDKPKHVTVEPGWYLYDLNSTHGTYLNKQRLTPNTYVRVRVGYMVKLGSSSRTYILQGPSEDSDDPSELTITELKQQRQQKEQLQREMAEIERQEKERIAKLKEEEGINWGMAEDADEETDLTHNPYAVSNNEELFLDDPKKTLRGYFEREGHDLDYRLEELSAGTYVCKVELPVDDDFGRPIVAEASHKGKKKEVVIQCALEACRILDRYGLLRQATHEPRRRHKKTSDSDEDDFLDRTGDIERRRQRKQTKSSTEVHTYEDLIRRESELLERLEELEGKIERHQMIEKGTRLPENDEDVDDFLTKLSEDKPYDKFEIRRLRLEKDRLMKDHVTLQKLIKIAKPVDLSGMSQQPGGSRDSKEHFKNKMMPLFGKRNKLSKSFGIKKSDIKVGGSTSAYGEEIEEDEEEQTSKLEVQSKPKESSKRTLGPSFNPELLEVHRKKSTQSEVIEQVPSQDTVSSSSVQLAEAEPMDVKTGKRKSEPLAADSDSVPDAGEVVASKKKRNRPRGRERNRDNVDIDDSEELQSEEKNIEWVPPENQSGDGITSLNEKFGY